MGKVLFVIAPKNFRDEELMEPKKVLEGKGHKVVVASMGKNECTGMLGKKVKPDIDVKEAKAEDYDAVIIIGGSGAAGLAENKEVLKLVKKAKELGKVYGAICIAPMVLGKAGVAKGKKLTLFRSEEAVRMVKEGGAEIVEQDVVQDEKMITASGPKAAKKFGEAIDEML
ncbi:DJ-1/PfpI family protein [Candidatus Micrarchaeota archaeon]|nr:DJ-1/PfpI family protein [Candidatus Micrarchaeota archaeon]